jgi:tryptophan halogenase
MPEAGAFNAAVRRLAENVRDFQMAHYKLNRRFDDAFWNRARDADAPSSLQRKLSLFGLRGIVPLNDDESFSEWNWAQSFLGHGLIPEGYDVRIDRVPDEDHVMKVQKRMRDVAELVRRMPTVGQFLSSTEASSAENVRA